MKYLPPLLLKHDKSMEKQKSLLTTFFFCDVCVYGEGGQFRILCLQKIILK